jgi:sterol desaturase/sphingolipid hydroxylase (fatty acid hydroxylase superfamily)
MEETILASEPVLRLSVFFGIFAAMILWEVLAPRRPQTQGRLSRWPNNIGIAILNTLLLRLLIPTAAVGLAFIAAERGWGLLNLVTLPGPLALFLGVMLLDLAIYLQHMVFHAVPLFWRLHRMHHTDLEVDVTTGARFHPIEILLSMGIKMLLVLALGPSALAVLIFEVILNAASMFNHANVKIPLALDRFLQLFIVTPDMHRVHHSNAKRETNSNYGFSLSIWDRLFRTYTKEPGAGQLGMTLGLEIFRAPIELRLDKMLLQPFKSPPSEEESSKPLQSQ